MSDVPLPLWYVPQRHRVPRIANLRSPDRYPGYSWEDPRLFDGKNDGKNPLFRLGHGFKYVQVRKL